MALSQEITAKHGAVTSICEDFMNEFVAALSTHLVLFEKMKPDQAAREAEARMKAMLDCHRTVTLIDLMYDIEGKL